MSKPLILPPMGRTEVDAKRFARTAHAGQTDKAGRPYFRHLISVYDRAMQKAALCPFWDDADIDEAGQLSWLHDVIEDTDYDGDDLLREGFSTRVVSAIDMRLSKHHPVPYAEWIEWLCRVGDLPVLLVKLSDNEDNADPERLAKLDEATRARLLAKYEPSMAMLREAARAKGWQG